MSGTPTPRASELLSTGGASDGVNGYNCPYQTVGAGTPLSGLVYRWRLWPGDPDVPQLNGMSSQFFLAPNANVGFGTKSPVERVHSGANLRADGVLLGQMGASGQVASALLTATVSTAASSNVAGGVPTTLVAYSLPATTLIQGNEGIRISAFGSLQNNTNPKYLSVYFGATSILTSQGLSFTGGSWYLQADVYEKSVHSQVGGGVIVAATLPAAQVATTGFASAAEREGQAITVAIQASSAQAGDVTLQGFVVEFANANTS
jgi:hypothetical protein